MSDSGFSSHSGLDANTTVISSGSSDAAAAAAAAAAALTSVHVHGHVHGGSTVSTAPTVPIGRNLADALLIASQQSYCRMLAIICVLMTLLSANISHGRVRGKRVCHKKTTICARLFFSLLLWLAMGSKKWEATKKSAVLCTGSAFVLVVAQLVCQMVVSS